eukprot:3731693-Alexandrium_andersonii.AAC.1
MIESQCDKAPARCRLPPEPKSRTCSMAWCLHVLSSAAERICRQQPMGQHLIHDVWRFWAVHAPFPGS